MTLSFEMEKEEEEIELSTIVTAPHSDDDDDVDFEDFHTPDVPIQTKHHSPPLRDVGSRKGSLVSPRKRESSPRKRESSPRKRESSPRRISYHQRIVGGTRQFKVKNSMEDLMKTDAGKMINLAAIEEGKEELEDLENEIERRKDNLMKGVAVQSTLRRRRVRRKRRIRNVDAFDGGESGSHDHLPKRQLSKLKLPALRDLKWSDVKYIARHFIKSHTFENVILVVVILNVIALCVQISLRDVDSNDTALEILFWFQFLCLLFYSVEAFFKIVLFQYNYFRSGWNVMDLMIVLIDWIGVFTSGSGGLSAIRVHFCFPSSLVFHTLIVSSTFRYFAFFEHFVLCHIFQNSKRWFLLCLQV